MRITTSLNYATDPTAAAAQAQQLEAAGVDRIWIPEAYGFDAVSLLGFLAAGTDTVELASGKQQGVWVAATVGGDGLGAGLIYAVDREDGRVRAIEDRRGTRAAPQGLADVEH